MLFELATRRQQLQLVMSSRRPSEAPVRLVVERERLIVSAQEAFARLSKAELLRPWKVTFAGEAARDIGGVRREFVTLLSRALCKPEEHLFEEVTDHSFLPSAESLKRGRNHLKCFEFVGIFLAKCLLEGELLDVHLCPVVYKRILGKRVSYHDMAAVDRDFYRHQVLWVRDHDITDIMFQDFTCVRTVGASRKTVELCPQGTERTVDNTNKLEYLDLLVEFKLSAEREPQLRALLQGFYSLISARDLQAFHEEELARVLEGDAGFSVSDLRSHTLYTQGYDQSSVPAQLLWQTLQEFSPAQRACFLQFVTGSPRLPSQGCSALEPVFTIQRVEETSKLPSASTCFNRLKLPGYASADDMRQKLLMAIEEGGEGFAFS